MLKFCEFFILKVANKNNLRAIHTQVKIKNNIRPIISSKRKEYDFYPNQRNINRDELVQLTSKGWHSRKSKGDYFIIHMSEEEEMIDINKTFSELEINKELIKNLEEEGIKHPSFIQSQAIPVLFAKKNALIAAETGCGKTLAYLLPALQQILQEKKSNSNNAFNSPLCLILTPSRELAHQIEYVAKNIIKNLNIDTDVIVGGGTKRKMLNPNFKEVDLLVATLGALSKLTTTGIYKMNNIRHVILDEADTLLDESFSEKLSYFLKKIPLQFSGDQKNFSGSQLTLVSATMPTIFPEVVSDVILPESLTRVTSENLHRLLAHVPQRFIRLTKSERAFSLLQLVKADVAKDYPVVIFSNKSATCDWISLFLNENGVNCVNLNGEMSLNLRKNRFVDFQKGLVNVLSCTDVGSRGLDTTRVKHVINFDFPIFCADYIHRCGRIGRIGSPSNCHVTNFISGFREIELTQKIEMSVRKKESLPNVNGNISGIIRNKIMRNLEEAF